MRQFHSGYWVNQRQLADLRQVFGHVGSYTSVFRRVFTGHIGPFTSGFCRVFWACGAHLRRVLAGLWAGFSWFFGLGFRGFWAVSVAGKEEVAEVAVTSLLFSRLRLFCADLARRVANVHNTGLFLLPRARGYRVLLP